MSCSRLTHPSIPLLSLQVKALAGLEAQLVTPSLLSSDSRDLLAGDSPRGLFGGPLLGVSLKRPHREAAALTGDPRTAAMQLFSWEPNRHVRIGNEVPEPRWLSWEPEMQHAALGYRDKVRCVGMTLVCTVSGLILCRVKETSSMAT